MRYLCTLSLLVMLAANAASASPELAAEQARQSTGGRVLSVEVSTDPQRPGFLVKVLLGDGRVRVVHVNPQLTLRRQSCGF